MLQPLAFSQRVLTNLAPSIMALVCAYAVWNSISKSQVIDAIIPVAVVLLHAEDKRIIAPDHMYAHIRAPRSTIIAMRNTTKLCIDVLPYQPGNHAIDEQDLICKLTAVPDDAVVLNLRPLFSLKIEEPSPPVAGRTACTPPSLVPTASEVPLELTSLPQQILSNLAVQSDTGQSIDRQALPNLL